MARRQRLIRPTAAALLLAAAGSLAGCSGDEPAPDDPSSPGGTTGSGATAPFANDADTRAALAVVESYYASADLRDCPAMRDASTVEEQMEDDAWATCVDTLLEQAGDGYSYEVGDGSVDGDTATFSVDVPLDVGTRSDLITLVRTDGRWLVDDGFVTAP